MICIKCSKQYIGTDHLCSISIESIRMLKHPNMTKNLSLMFFGIKFDQFLIDSQVRLLNDASYYRTAKHPYIRNSYQIQLTTRSDIKTEEELNIVKMDYRDDFETSFVKFDNDFRNGILYRCLDILYLDEVTKQNKINSLNDSIAYYKNFSLSKLFFSRLSIIVNDFFERNKLYFSKGSLVFINGDYQEVYTLNRIFLHFVELHEVARKVFTELKKVSGIDLLTGYEKSLVLSKWD